VAFADYCSSYALERHLRRDEVIHPLQEVGKFRGKPVYPRSNVQRLRTAETWMREGRVIQLGQQPLKRVTQRAHTINKKRVMELVKANGANEMPTQGLWAEWQTELYVADPVVDVRRCHCHIH
jgi:xeroderma pigmentosum group C-complementing protein